MILPPIFVKFIEKESGGSLIMILPLNFIYIVRERKREEDSQYMCIESYPPNLKYFITRGESSITNSEGSASLLSMTDRFRVYR